MFVMRQWKVRIASFVLPPEFRLQAGVAKERPKHNVIDLQIIIRIDTVTRMQPMMLPKVSTDLMPAVVLAPPNPMSAPPMPPSVTAV